MRTNFYIFLVLISISLLSMIFLVSIPSKEIVITERLEVIGPINKVKSLIAKNKFWKNQKKLIDKKVKSLDYFSFEVEKYSDSPERIKKMKELVKKNKLFYKKISLKIEKEKV